MRTIKHNQWFWVDDTEGHIPFDNDQGMGLYVGDTRHLSGYELTLNGHRPVPLLSSSALGYLSTLVYTNPPLHTEDLPIAAETLQLTRESVIEGAFLERFTLMNYNSHPLPVTVSFQFQADFRDIFEVRHMAVHQGQTDAADWVDPQTVVFGYTDSQGHRLQTRICFRGCNPHPTDGGGAELSWVLPPLTPVSFDVCIEAQTPILTAQPAPQFEEALSCVQRVYQDWHADTTRFVSDNQDFNEMIQRSQRDLRMLWTDAGDHHFMAAGIPWFTTLFGRDSLITARDCLILNPLVAQEVLTVLAQFQGQEHNPWRDEEPGKILHELRRGELARRGDIPHTPYYGTVDATPLWLMLLEDYGRWTQDDTTLKRLWPHARQAARWILTRLKAQGYLYYDCQSEKGLLHQGWKDSDCSAVDDLGQRVPPPIALAEVQGYAYQALRAVAAMATRYQETALAIEARDAAQALKQRFQQDFWLADEGFCAMAVTVDRRALKVVSSNPGHCLETGILNEDQALEMAARLMAPDMFSGWGIRTLSAECRAYNPMSYHNGSIWPHDNAMVARGFAALGRTDWAEQVFSTLFEAARMNTYRRLPELFCGFNREPGRTDPPVAYPVACSPQAWAASSVFAFLNSLLGFQPTPGGLRIAQPRLPRWTERLRVENLVVGGSMLSLEFKRAHKSVVVDVLERHGKLDLLLAL